MKAFVKAAVLGLAVLAAPSVASAEDGDAERGQRVFGKCRACHVADQEQNRVGPYLKGIVGRQAGTIAGFNYSAINKAAGEAGLVWDADNLFEYLEDPNKFLPKFLTEAGKADQAKGRSKMVFKLANEQERRDVIAYLKTVSPATN
ncbi:MAG: c-type cytochrome [Hyphomicrobiaceae bacterium]